MRSEDAQSNVPSGTPPCRTASLNVFPVGERHGCSAVGLWRTNFDSVGFMGRPLSSSRYIPAHLEHKLCTSSLAIRSEMAIQDGGRAKNARISGAEVKISILAAKLLGSRGTSDAQNMAFLIWSMADLRTSLNAQLRM